jgi:uncharacterized protein YcfJ
MDNRYINLILISMLMFVLSPMAWSNSVFQQLGEVTKVSPMYGMTNVTHQLPQQIKVCYKRDSNGLLEKITDGGFGSTRGLIGTAIGVTIGNEIGGGSGNEAARVIGGLIGNKIGNNIDHAKKGTECRVETQMQSHSSYQQTVIGYGVTVQLSDGKKVNVTRDFQPQVGDMLTLNIRVW